MSRKDVIRDNLIGIPFKSTIVKYDYYLEGVIDVNVGTEGFVEELITLKDGRIVTFSSDETIRIISKTQILEVENKVNSYQDVTVLPDGNIALIGDYNIVQIINPDEGKTIFIFQGHKNYVFQLFVLEYEDSYSIMSLDGTDLLIWDPYTGKIINELKGNGYSPIVKLSNDRIAIGNGPNIEIINLNTHQVDFILKGDPEKRVFPIYLSSNGKLLTTYVGGYIKVKIWDLNTQEGFEHPLNYSPGNNIRLVNDEYLIDLDNNGKLMFRNINTGICDFEYQGEKDVFYGGILILPDGRIAIPLNGQILIFNTDELPKGNCIRIEPELILDALYPHLYIDLLPDGRIVSASSDSDEEHKELFIWK